MSLDDEIMGLCNPDLILHIQGREGSVREARHGLILLLVVFFFFNGRWKFSKDKGKRKRERKKSKALSDLRENCKET